MEWRSQANEMRVAFQETGCQTEMLGKILQQFGACEATLARRLENLSSEANCQLQRLYTRAEQGMQVVQADADLTLREVRAVVSFIIVCLCVCPPCALPLCI